MLHDTMMRPRRSTSPSAWILIGLLLAAAAGTVPRLSSAPTANDSRANQDQKRTRTTKGGGADADSKPATEGSEEELNRLFDEEEGRKPAAGTAPASKSLVQVSDRKGRSYELDLFGSGDIVGGWDRAQPHTTENRLQIREVEFALSANVDHLAQAFFSFTGHEEKGETTAGLEEAYLLFPTLLPRSTLKVGRFFFDAGRLNSSHRHEWAFTGAPLVHDRLLGADGASDTGLEWHFLMPWSFWQELSVGVFNGENFGQDAGWGSQKQNPLAVARLKQFIPFGAEWGTQFGFSWLRWHSDGNPNKVSQQSGLDLLLKWKRGHLSSFQWSSEIWYRETRETRAGPLAMPAGPVVTFLGGYTFFEYQFAENWYAGLRLDGFTEPNRRGQLGYTYPNGAVSGSVMLTYKPSEFSRFRVTGERTTEIETGERTFQGYIQATFVIGFHPAHQY